MSRYPRPNVVRALLLSLAAVSAIVPVGEADAQTIPSPPPSTAEQTIPPPPSEAARASTEPPPSASPAPAEPPPIAAPVNQAPPPAPVSLPPLAPAPLPPRGAPVVQEPPPATASAPFPVRPYGILWAGVFVTQPVQSFGYATANAPTAAANPALFPDTNKALLTFQVQQTRAGLVVGEGTAFKGTLEIDFIHFDVSSPTTLAFPRLRIALLEWKPNAHQKLFIGQTWDIFGDDTGPLLSHSFNLVGTLFQAGNIGFMRQQLGWTGSFGRFELAVAAGLQGANNGPSFNYIEQSMTPTVAGRLMYHLPRNHGQIGISGLGTSLRFMNGAAANRQMALGGELFADVTLGGLIIHAELYLAQNLANLGSLNLGQGRFGTNVADAGGYISCRYEHGHHAFTAMFGAAAVLNPSHVAPAYVVGAGMPTTTPAAPNVAAGPGILYNTTAHVGYWYSPLRGLSIVFEPYIYATKFKIAAVDVAIPSKNTSVGASLGAIFQF